MSKSLLWPTRVVLIPMAQVDQSLLTDAFHCSLQHQSQPASAGPRVPLVPLVQQLLLHCTAAPRRNPGLPSPPAGSSTPMSLSFSCGWGRMLCVQYYDCAFADPLEASVWLRHGKLPIVAWEGDSFGKKFSWNENVAATDTWSQSQSGALVF